MKAPWYQLRETTAEARQGFSPRTHATLGARKALHWPPEHDQECGKALGAYRDDIWLDRDDITHERDDIRPCVLLVLAFTCEVAAQQVGLVMKG